MSENAMRHPHQPPSERCRRLLRQIQAGLEGLDLPNGRRALDGRVLTAMARVPREAFVPPGAQPFAYANVVLPIGHGQTISQPITVAIMTDLLQPSAEDVVLEVGTGSGYQAAVLATLVRQVYSMEVVEALAEEARERLARLGFANVEVRQGDGYAGWPDHAPFDAILVTAAVPRIPPPLQEQLKRGGRMVLPVDDGLQGQDLVVVEKTLSGRVTTRNVTPVVFAMLTRDAKTRRAPRRHVQRAGLVEGTGHEEGHALAAKAS